MFAMTVEQVVRSYADMVYRLACAQLRNQTDADDVFQEVFLRYTRKHPVFRDEEHLKAWLLRVTVNCCRSHQRSALLRRIVPLTENDAPALPPPEVSVLEEALARLPARHRTVIHLFYYENCSTAQIAEATSQSASTVRSQLTRARTMLREILKGEIDHVQG